MKYQFLTKIIIPLLVGFAFSTSVLADEGNTPTSQSPQTTSDDLAGGQAFLNGKEEGWFWRKSPPEPVKKKPVKLPPPPTLPPQETPKQVAQTPMESTPEPAATEKPGPAPFTVAWFNENIQKLRNQPSTILPKKTLGHIFWPNALCWIKPNALLIWLGWLLLPTPS